jgi:hypothetical protein
MSRKTVLFVFILQEVLCKIKVLYVFHASFDVVDDIYFRKKFF